MILLRQGNSELPVGIFRRFQARCLRTGLAVLVGIQALAGMRAHAGDAEPVVEPPSKWVVPRSFDKPSADDVVDPTQEYRWLLSDRQINAQSNEEFVHQARQTLNPAGVQDNSHISISYDPTSQSLTFHWARLWRGKNKLDRLDLSKLHISPAGLDTDASLFSSEKKALLMLDDVQVGDIVDYAYTIGGTNPALAGKFSDSVQLQFSQPVDRNVTRLIWPSSRRLFIKNHLTDIQPVTSRKSNVVEYLWDVRHEPGLHREPQTPVWYDPYAWVQLSEFQKWADIDRWALRLFTTTNPPSPELTQKIKEWKQLPAPEDRVLAALRFVQEEVRYLGTEDEPAGSEPAQPSVVFARRFGDGKDKSFLLVTILRALKIEAFPVLVNDQRRQELAELQPSPTVFNRVVVQVNLSGQSYWLDTTATYERGALALRSWPNYAWGLTVSPGAIGLTPIPPCPVQPKTTVREYLNVGGLNDRSTVKIVTVAEGPDATRLREHFATTPREDIERDNLNAFSKLYPFMSLTSPLLYSDDEQQNRIEITEFYAIDRMWSRQPDEPYYHCRVYCVKMEDALVKPAVAFRTMPLAVQYPVHQIFHAEVSLVTVWPISPSNTTIQNPAFYFQRLVNVVDGRLFLDCEYRSWADAVAPDAVPGYVHDLDSATDALGYTVIGLW
jgi:transglutaminase-like putative cysteine protease